MEEVRRIIDKFIKSENPSNIIGLEESNFLEFKQSFYDTSPSGRYEFAKDISSFANADGGYIVIGIATKPSEVKNTDVSRDIMPIHDCTSAMIGLCKGVIYPELKRGVDYEVDFIELDKAIKEGIAVIRVNKSDKRRLIMNVVEDDETIKNIVVGYVIRKGSSSEPDTPQMLYEKMQSGFNPHNQMTERILSEVVAIRDAVTSQPVTGGGKLSSKLVERMDN